MRDQLSIQRVKDLHPAISVTVEHGINLAEDKLGPKACIRVVQGIRTIQYQHYLYAQGRTRPGKIVTNAKGGRSFHNYGLAFDFAIMYDLDSSGTFETLSWDTLADKDIDGESDWMEVVEVFKGLGFTWGGDFVKIKDNPHFQKTFGLTWLNLLNRYNSGRLIKGTNFVLI